jgi:hypothetical protein
MSQIVTLIVTLCRWAADFVRVCSDLGGTSERKTWLWSGRFPSCVSLWQNIACPDKKISVLHLITLPINLGEFARALGVFWFSGRVAHERQF